MFDNEPPFARAAQLYEQFMQLLANVLFGLLVLGIVGVVGFAVWVAIVTTAPQHPATTTAASARE